MKIGSIIRVELLESLLHSDVFGDGVTVSIPLFFSVVKSAMVLLVIVTVVAIKAVVLPGSVIVIGTVLGNVIFDESSGHLPSSTKLSDEQKQAKWDPSLVGLNLGEFSEQKRDFAPHIFGLSQIPNEKKELSL